MKLKMNAFAGLDLNFDQLQHFTLDGEGWVRHHGEPPKGILTRLTERRIACSVEKVIAENASGVSLARR